MKRYPNGVDSTFFFEKHVPGPCSRVGPPPAGALHARTAARSTTRSSSDRPTLVWAANLAAIEFHVPLWHFGRRRVLPAPPDHMVFDLDPGGGTSIVECCRVAQMVAEILGRGPIGLLAEDQRFQGPPALRAAHWPTDVGEDPRSGPRDRRPAWSGTIPTRSSRTCARASVPARSSSTGVRTIRPRPRWPPTRCGPGSEPTVSTPVSWDEVDACCPRGDPSDLRFTSDLVLERIEALGICSPRLIGRYNEPLPVDTRPRMLECPGQRYRTCVTRRSW